MSEPFSGQKGGGCRKLNVCTPSGHFSEHVQTGTDAYVSTHF